MNLLKRHIKKTGKVESLRGYLRIPGAWSLAFGAMLLMASCSDEVRVPEETPEEDFTEAAYYLTLNLTTASSSNSRSYTEGNGGSSDGTQDGLDNESTIESAQVYIFKASSNNPADNDCVLTLNATETVSGEYKAVYAKMTLDQVKSLFKHQKLHLYVVANAEEIGPFTNESALHEAQMTVTSPLGSESYARPFTDDSKNGYACPMTNYDYYTITISTTLDEDPTDAEVNAILQSIFTGSYRDKAGNKGRLWNISADHGFLKLERCIARVDFYNYPEEEEEEGEPVFKLENATGNNGEKVKLRLKGMQLFNVGMKAYWFRHTSEGNSTFGQIPGGQIKVFGKESWKLNQVTEEDVPSGADDEDTEDAGEGDVTADNLSYNWIYDCDWTTKLPGGIKEDGMSLTNTAFFHNQPTVTEETDEVSKEKTYKWSINSTDAITSYTELYSNGNSYSSKTGGYLPWFYITENTVPSTDLMGLPYSTGVAFKFQVILYQEEKVTGDDGETETKEVPVVVSKDKQIRVTMSDSYYQEPEWDEVGKYYYFTYKYLIEHNNNTDGHVSGGTGLKNDKAPMQIGVVRNNLYQLKIEKITYVPTPHDPDNIDILIDCSVKDWDVRWDDDVTLY